MEKILMGKVVNAVGIKGEVKVYNFSDSGQAYEDAEMLFLDDVPHRVENVRMQKNTVILKLEGIHDRNDAESIKGCEVFITEDDLPVLPEGQFYIRELIGMTVKEESGQCLGTVKNVMQNSAQDILEVEGQDKNTILIPKVDEFVLNIDGKTREIVVKLIDGLKEL